MNQTSSSPAVSSQTATSLSNGTDFTSLLTNVHLIWIAIFAVLVVAGIVYGSVLKRRRRAAERRVVDHAEEAGVEPQPPAEDRPAPGAPTPAAEARGDVAAGSIGQLKGLGPKVAARLGELGITTVGQLAALDYDAALRLDAQLGAFRGRMERDRWIEQARFLAAGDVKGFEAVFGRL